MEVGRFRNPRNRWLNALIGKRPGRYWLRNLSCPALAPETRARLQPVFRDELLRLQDLIDRGLSTWLT